MARTAEPAGVVGKKTWSLKKITQTLVLLALAVPATAQEAPEYRAEIGGGVGLVAYEGDFNGNPLRNQQPMLTAVGRYRLNPRMAVAAHVSWGQLRGSSADAHTSYPLPEQTRFKHAVVDVGGRYEYHFWPYGTGKEYRGAQRLTPYIYIGVGVTVANPGSAVTALNVPIGGGVKYKMGDRFNVALEWTAHFTASDRLDGVADPYGIRSSGLFKNTDGYSHLQVSLTYDIWKKCKTCNNDI